MKKVSIIYTGQTEQLTAMIQEALAETFQESVTIFEQADPSIIEDANRAGHVTKACARRLTAMYMKAAEQDADIILNVCSSVGGIAKLATPLFAALGIPIVRIDDAMARYAVLHYDRIAVVATLKTTMEPTLELLHDCALEYGRHVELSEVYVSGAFGKDPDEFRDMLIEASRETSARVDVLLFAQGSMAYMEQDVSNALGIPVLSSIRFGVKDLKCVLDRET